MPGKHSNEVVIINGMKFYLAALMTNGKVSGYLLQPEDEFPEKPV